MLSWEMRASMGVSIKVIADVKVSCNAVAVSAR